MTTLRVPRAAAGLLIAALVGSGACATVTRFRAAPETSSLAASPATLPARLEHGQFIVQATIDGTGPWRLVFDTGASVLLLSPRVAEAARLRRGGSENGEPFEIEGAKGKKAHLDEAALVDQVSVGPLTLRGIDAFLMDLRPIVRTSGTPVDGILPVSVFGRVLVTLDFDAGTVVVAEGALPPPDGLEVFALEDHPLPRVMIELGGRPTPVLIDSGSNEFLALPDGAQDRVRFRSPPREAGRIRTVGGDVGRLEGRLADDVLWGRHRLSQPVVEIGGADYGSCGTGLLASFRTTIDMAHHRVRFERTSDAPIKSASVRSPGFGVLHDDAGWTVGYVLDGAPAAQAGLREGDRIDRVEGLPASEIDPTIYAVLLATGRELRLHVVGPEGGRDVVVPIATIVE